VVCGLWSVVCGLRSVVCGLRSAVCGLWSVVCGLWSVVCGLRSVVCGLWSVVHEMSSQLDWCILQNNTRRMADGCWPKDRPTAGANSQRGGPHI